MAEAWSIIEAPFRVEHAKAYEGLFTLGSGYLHIRGSLEEHLPDAPQNVEYTRLPANVTAEVFRHTKSKWGTYVPGLFGKHPLLNNEMINLPWLIGLAPIVDGERLDMERCTIESYRRELHLNTATLTRTLTWRTRSGKTVELQFERFVSGARPHASIQKLVITSDAAAELQIRAGIDADVRTNGFDHLTDITFDRKGDILMGGAWTDARDLVVFSTHVRVDPPAPVQCEMSARAADLIATTRLQPNRPVTIEKRSAIATSRDERDTSHLTAAFDELLGISYEQLEAEHVAHWHKRWQTCDVIIKGDAESQLAMRVSLFHLLRAHVPGDSRVAIDAKGYAGEAYWGRFFWDTEMFLMPFFLYTDPPRARTLADFRVQSLSGARENAKRYGYPGARYGWESDAAGIECCPNWQYGDHEVHVTADVAYGLTHYARAADDAVYLQGEAARVLVETARYWMARLDQRRGEKTLSLLGVMGPDEYTPISSNNAFTNAMVSGALRAAAEHGRHAGASLQECEAFGDAAARLQIPRRDDGLILQCEEFDRLAEPRFEELWKDRNRTFASQVSQERLYRSKALKQADVLMIMMLFPQQFTDAQLKQAWDYYVPYTTHDSSLSAGAHAILATRLGLEKEAWEFWVKARAIDLDVEHGGAAEGIHIANAGAVWQMAVLGFAGMRTALQSEVLTLSPRLPRAWSLLAFPIVWKGTPLYVELTRESAQITNRGERPVRVVVRGREETIPAQESRTWPTGA